MCAASAWVGQREAFLGCAGGVPAAAAVTKEAGSSYPRPTSLQPLPSIHSSATTFPCLLIPYTLRYTTAIHLYFISASYPSYSSLRGKWIFQKTFLYLRNSGQCWTTSPPCRRDSEHDDNPPRPTNPFENAFPQSSRVWPVARRLAEFLEARFYTEPRHVLDS